MVESIISTTMVLIELILGIIFQISAFVGFCFLLCKSRQSNSFQLSHSMKLYVNCCIIQSISGFIHFMYLAVFWDKEIVTYNSYFMFFTGTLGGVLLMAISLCIIFLSLDRILIVLFPHKYNVKAKKITAKFAFFLITAITLGIIAFDILKNFPATNVTNCRTQICLRENSSSLFYAFGKICVASLNVITGTFLGVILKKHLHGNSINAKANRIVFITMIFGFIFDFMPNFAALLILPQELKKIQGPHTLFFGSIEVAAGAFLYCNNMFKQSNYINVAPQNNLNVSRNI